MEEASMAARPLRQGIERYCAWYKLVRSWTLLQAVFFAACAAVALYILCDKVFYFGIGYLPVILTVAIISLFVLLVYHLTARRKASLVSYLVDKSAGLKNLVSSGISVAEEPDEVSTVVVNRATAALQSAAPARLLPFRLHWTGLYIYIPVLLLLVAFFIPHLDLAGRKQKNDQAVAEQAVVKKGALKLAAKLTSIQSR